jgi:NAD-specific glutamate dehydrogenase
MAACRLIYPAFPEGGVARVHFIIGRSEGKTPQIEQEQLERDVRSIVTRWEDQLHALGGDAAARMSVSQSYKERFRPDEALADLDDILACAEPGNIRIAFYRGQDMENDSSGAQDLSCRRTGGAVTTGSAAGKSRLQGHQRTNPRDISR